MDTQTQVPLESSAVTTEKRFSPFFILIFFLFLLLGGGFIFFTSAPNENEVISVESSALLNEPSGKIYMTLLSKDAALQENPGIPTALAYDLSSKTFTKVFDGGKFSSQHFFSPSGDHVGFLGIALSSEQDISDLYSINMYVYQGEVSASGHIRDISNKNSAEGFAKYSPAISNDGKILFALLKEGNTTAMDPRFADITTPNVWDIMLIDEGETKMVANGVYPHWATPTQFVFLKDDGLYYYDIDRDAEVQLVANTSSTPFSNASMLDVSDSGSLIVWSVPSTGQAFLLEARDWSQDGGPKLYTRNIFKVFGFWPVLSPDEKYFALETIDPTIQNSLTNPKPKLEFYNTETFEKAPLEVDLDDYDQMEMYVTDWK